MEEGDDLEDEAAEDELIDDQLRTVLEQDPAWLAEDLLQAADDPLLRARLEAAAGSAPDVSTYAFN